MQATRARLGAVAPSLFPSFFLAGFECATPINWHGQRIDPLAATEHDRRVREDYRALQRLGIRAVREGARWNRIDRDGRYDFRPLRPFVEAAQEAGLTVIWDLQPENGRLERVRTLLVDQYRHYASRGVGSVGQLASLPPALKGVS